MKYLVRRIIAGFVLLSFMLCLVACENVSVKDSETNDSRVVVDMSGNEITIPSEISTYAVAWAGLTDIVAMFDDFERCAAFPEKSTKFNLLFEFCPDLEGKQQLPDKGISAESLINLNVQVVFLKGSDDEDLNNKLKQCGISVIDCEFQDYEGLEKVVNLIGETFGTEDTKQIADKYNKYIEEQVENANTITSRIPDKDRLSAIVIRDTSDYSAFGQTRYTGKWVEICGADYAMKNKDSYANVNLTKEQLLEYDPDIIFFSMPGEAQKFLADDSWSGMTAVQAGRVYNVPNGLNTWSNSGSESALIFPWAQSIMYPELVNYDINQVVRDYYAVFYSYDLTEPEIGAILNP